MSHSTMRRGRVLKIAGTATGALLALTVTAGCNDPVAPPQQQQEQQEQQDEGRDPQDNQHEGNEPDDERDDGGAEQDDD
ncbi:hypothetical protein ACL03H_11950 [Saccharopolyspora sp. MS10]|uniref:hypothetical protein n=1 Tax=Saccharopolyspora sp. MS10 TaxID=3385973 RepID=UPI00399F00AA